MAKQTIYRWWSSKTDILMDALLEDIAEDLEAPDSGNLRDDLRSYLAKLAHFLSRSDSGAVFRALSAQSQLDPIFAARFRSEYLSRQREVNRTPLLRAIQRGELDADIDLDAAVDQLVGPIYYRVLVTGQEVHSEFTDLLASRFLNWASARRQHTRG